MKNQSPASRSEKDYQGEDDARHLMKAHEVLSDPKRHAAAKKHLGKLHKENKAQAAHANAAKGLLKAFPPDQQNAQASKPGMDQANGVC